MSATVLPDETPLDPDDELLVAYLDGELSREDQSNLEDRLLEEESLRRRLQHLQSGWDLLEVLPDPAPSLKLVESTLELAVADIVKDEPTKPSRWSKWRWPVLVGLVSVFGVLGAYGVIAAKRYGEYSQQLRDLAIVENLDAYVRGNDIALMRQISARPDWNAMVAASREMGDLKFDETERIANVELQQREQMVGELPLEKLRQLNLRWDKFSNMSFPEREEIHRTARAVEQQADPELLLDTMQTYAVWVQTLPTELRDGIESNDPTLRRESITSALELTQSVISRRSIMKLDDETFQWIYFALQQIVRQRVDDGDEATIASLERNRERVAPEHDVKYPTIAWIVIAGSERGRGGPPGGGPPGGGARGGGPPGGGPPGGGPRGGGPNRRRPGAYLAGAPGGGQRPRPLDARELNTVRLMIPDQSQSVLELVAQGDELLEEATLRVWTEEAVRRNYPFDRKDDSTWLERYNDLDSEDRDFIDLLPPKEILNELSRDSLLRSSIGR